jgi:hypothetical protein
MNTGSPGDVVLSRYPETYGERHGIFKSLSRPIARGRVECVCCIADLDNSPLRRHPNRLRLSQHQFELVDIIIGSCSDCSIGGHWPSLNPCYLF